MPVVGFAPCYGVFPQIPAEQISFQEVMGDWRAHNARTLERLPGRFLLLKENVVSWLDFESGFCSPPLTKDALLKQLKGRPYRLIPRRIALTAFGQQLLQGSFMAEAVEVLSSPRALPTQSPLDQVKQLFSFHGPRARGVLVLTCWSTSTLPELALMMIGETPHLGKCFVCSLSRKRLFKLFPPASATKCFLRRRQW
eukprot:s6184_g2.t1